MEEPAIWLMGDAVTQKRDCVTNNLIPPATFCTVDVEGIFESGGKFGHLGQYQFEIRGIAETPAAYKSGHAQSLPLKNTPDEPATDLMPSQSSTDELRH